jgi:hypothetical protein
VHPAVVVLVVAFKTLLAEHADSHPPATGMTQIQ